MALWENCFPECHSFEVYPGLNALLLTVKKALKSEVKTSVVCSSFDGSFEMKCTTNEVPLGTLFQVHLGSRFE